MLDVGVDVDRCSTVGACDADPVEDTDIGGGLNEKEASTNDLIMVSIFFFSAMNQFESSALLMVNHLLLGEK